MLPSGDHRSEREEQGKLAYQDLTLLLLSESLTRSRDNGIFI